MENPKDMLLADAVKQAIEKSRAVIKYRKIITGLAITNIITLIILVVLICV